MPTQCYDIFFSGKTVEGTDPAEVKENLGKIFNMGNEQLEYLFAGNSVKVKGGVDQETAIRYRVAFRDAGALVEIQSADPVTDSAHTTPSVTPENQTLGKMALLPPRTGSLIDCAPKIQPAPLPDISELSLASPGTLLDESPSPEARPMIDTGNLELAPANTGTLEDCQTRKEPAILPDISQLSIAEDNN